MSDLNRPASFYAKLFDITERRVQQLAKDGVIPKEGRGMYPLVGTVRGYTKFLQERSAGFTFEFSDQDLRNERVRLTRVQADRQELKLKEESGSLIPAEEHAAVVSLIIKSLVNILDVLPDQIERDCGITPEVINSIQESIDAQRTVMQATLMEILTKHQAGEIDE